MSLPLVSRFQYEAIFNEAAIGILVTDSSSNVILTNNFADRLFGYETNELKGKNIDILIPNHLRSRHHGHQAKYAEHPQDRPMGVGLDLKAKRKDESLFPVEISLSHFKENDQMFYIAFISDVTLKRKVEMELILKNQEINQLNETLEEEVKARTQALQNTLEKLEANTQELENALQKEKELGDLKTRFVSMASHEFRTPLTSILSSATLLEKYQKAEEQEKREQHIRRIKASVNHLTMILEEFLSVGKLESGHVEIHASTIELESLFLEIKADLIPYKKVNQKIILDFNASETWVSDESVLRKILLNALSNALKFSNEHVDLIVKEENNILKITIRDRGIGISDDDKKHLFERFFRGSNATVIPGTGLGLHLIDRYLELIKGQLKLESTLNQGTILTIEIPRLNHDE
ncbi:PAS domain-containing sensor histidine kinase [Aquirufa ecclesiirivi]|uniref:histidine kinase n=1 Tax=Aquirufa ecclesiirivi TaxID=2715124 RepID=A0ABT4JEZ0_9BACT|nr:PAS domain-containing sensor histidine kinase [Aquirufa ecclesiirivi]MCZ2471979.1 PAS domain S-box protein [Aquirufa ecclesiirivi]MCZ2474344.1 PAS domain S-box protein [Aquirufa ecclesiirivi]NHC48364.1 PAS domain S-box protein [Aquirufa ecclesiirivi]